MEKWFPQGIDGLLDDAVKAIVRPIENGLEYAEFLAVILVAVGLRRLKMLLLPHDELMAEEKSLPELVVENLPSMTDAEVAMGFEQLNALARAKFIVAMRKVDGPSGQRFKSLLEQMKIGEHATREQNAAAIARRAQEEADKAREAAKEAEAKRPRRDDEAMAYIVQAPDGRFYTVVDIDALIRNGEGGGEVFDWVNRRQIPVGDAMVVGKCLITDKKTAERLAKKLRRLQDKDRPLAFSIATTREWLAQCEKENEAARARKAEEERAAKASEVAERGDFTAKVRGAFALTLNLPDKELARNRLKAECNGTSWKLGIIRDEAETAEQGIFVAFRQELRERFPHSSKSTELDAYIKEIEAKFIGRASAESWTDNVVKGAERHINIARRHKQWLADNPRGVVQPKPQADIIDLGRWESSADRARPKFGPGSGIGGAKKEKTQEERLIHRGRQLAKGDCRYWSGKFDKPVEKFTDDDFKKVVEIFGDVKGDRKAAKKQGGKKH